MDDQNNLTEVVETKNIVKTATGAEADGIFYNTVGGVLGGLMYCAVMKARKRL